MSTIAHWLSGLAPGEVRLNEPLAPWCSIRAGGSADALVRPQSVETLLAALKLAKDTGTPLSILGLGANTIVGDLGVRGLTLKLPNSTFKEDVTLDDEGGVLVLSAGASIARLVTLMKQHGLVGAEFLAGVPGTIGGAVTMNAGTKNGECMSRVVSLELATADGLGWVAPPQYRYRHTELPAGVVVTRAKFRLPRGDVAASQAAMDADLGYRKRTQPLSQPSFGSVFTNPPGHHAGALLEKVELKGHTIGGAQISTLHANWIVNLGGASVRDVTQLMVLAQQRVREATGVELVPEVKRLGEFAL
ncbi:MAG: UDP-N-acetylmuramate dehydrogenase [Myxococcales bacterium]|nr:UDP-N-acetylmuramate dehydrogenase [Myxococcales bacterium]